MKRSLTVLALGLLAGCFAGLGCQSAPKPTTRAPIARPPTATPASAATTAERLQPPPAGIVPDAPFPVIQRRELANGLALRVVERRVHPLIELRLVVRSGTATDGDKPGLAVIAGEMLKAGGAGTFGPQQLVERAESLGTNLEILTDRDATRIGLNVTTGHLDAALEILAAVALRPRFAPVEFTKLRDREIERVKSSARGSAAWAASMILYRELYSLPTSIHPYSRYDALPGELEKLTLADCKSWHQRHFVPSNATLVVAGDVTADEVLAATSKWFAGWKGTPVARSRGYSAGSTTVMPLSSRISTRRPPARRTRSAVSRLVAKIRSARRAARMIAGLQRAAVTAKRRRCSCSADPAYSMNAVGQVCPPPTGPHTNGKPVFQSTGGWLRLPQLT